MCGQLKFIITENIKREVPPTSLRIDRTKQFEESITGVPSLKYANDEENKNILL